MLHTTFSIGQAAQQGYSVHFSPLPATGNAYYGYTMQLMLYCNHISSKARVLKALQFILHSEEWLNRVTVSPHWSQTHLTLTTGGFLRAWGVERGGLPTVIHHAVIQYSCSIHGGFTLPCQCFLFQNPGQGVRALLCQHPGRRDQIWTGKNNLWAAQSFTFLLKGYD